jgi:D-amino-acid dehydrogenase
MKHTIAIIGTGIIGMWTAYEAQRQGHHVILIEAGSAGGEQAASFGNAAWIFEGSVLPISTPGLWREIPSYLIDPLGPFSIKLKYLLKLAPWLIQFVRAGNSIEKIETCALARIALLKDSLFHYRELARDLRLDRFVRQDGLVFVYPNRAEFENESLGTRLRNAYGLHWEEWDQAELHANEPELGHDYTFGTFHPYGGHLSDPGRFIALAVQEMINRGARLVSAEATGFAVEQQRLSGVHTTHGTIACDRAIICAGIHGKALAHQTGDHIPLESERGYHLVLNDLERMGRSPLMPSDGKMGVTMTDSGLRIAGQVELAGVSEPPDWRRTDILREYLGRLLPRTKDYLGKTTRWMGHRPSTPDGLPCLGPATQCKDIFHGYGHGHSGIGMAPASARLLLSLATCQAPPFNASPYRAERFQ